MNIYNIILEETFKVLKEDKNLDNKVKCIQSILQKELDNYKNEDIDDSWFEIRQELRKINNYFEDGYFYANGNDTKNLMSEFLSGLDYSTNHTYKMGEKVRNLPTSKYDFYKNSEMPVYKAIGNKTLFRGVSLEDWNRIKKQGYIDSDMRDAIVETEGINLGQIPSTAMYYLPANDKGVILAISPKDLDLYMLKDEYIRVFEPIPIKNIIKVSDVIFKNKIGSVLSMNTEKKINEIIDNLKKYNINITC